MIGSLMVLAIIAVILYPVVDIFILKSKLKKASEWIPVLAVVKDIRSTKSQVIKNKFISKHRIYFFCEGVINGIRYGYMNLTLYNGVNAHQRQIAKKISCGSEVKIYIDPKRPYVGCYLAPNQHRLTMSYLKLFSIWFLAGTGLYFYFS